MQLDPAKYRHFLACFDMSDDQKLAFIRDFGMVLDSIATQEFHGAADAVSLGIDRKKRVSAANDGLDSDDTLTSTFNDAAGETMAGKTIP